MGTSIESDFFIVVYPFFSSSEGGGFGEVQDTLAHHDASKRQPICRIVFASMLAAAT
jgi:hypothetical protein